MKQSFFLFLVFSLVACSDDDQPDLPDAMPAVNGDPCESDDACASGLCLLEFGAGPEEPGYIEFVDGMCSMECNDDFTGCPDDEICLKHNASGQFHCYLRCDTGEDCRDSYVCLDFTPYDVTDREAACIPESAI